jgi:hypothetical protein
MAPTFLFGRSNHLAVFKDPRSHAVTRLAEDQIALTLYCVDNDWWAAQSAQVDRAAIRSAWRVEPDSTVVLFCAKLQPWKRPGGPLEAFTATGIPVLSWFSPETDRCDKPCTKGLSTWESPIVFASRIS